MTSSELLWEIQKEYQRLRDLFIPQGMPVAQIKLLLITEADIEKNTPNLVSAYRDSEDSVTIAVPESSLDDKFALCGNSLLGITPAWKTDLLHEVIHEFQFKCVSVASQQGVDLMRNAKRHFPGGGHDEKFYTAIAVCAQRLGVTAEALEAII